MLHSIQKEDVGIEMQALYAERKSKRVNVSGQSKGNIEHLKVEEENHDMRAGLVLILC
jgi:hypothetical protein